MRPRLIEFQAQWYPEIKHIKLCVTRYFEQGFTFVISMPIILIGSDKGKMSHPQPPVQMVVTLWHCLQQPWPVGSEGIWVKGSKAKAARDLGGEGPSRNELGLLECHLAPELGKFGQSRLLAAKAEAGRPLGREWESRGITGLQGMKVMNQQRYIGEGPKTST